MDIKKKNLNYFHPRIVLHISHVQVTVSQNEQYFTTLLKWNQYKILCFFNHLNLPTMSNISDFIIFQEKLEFQGIKDS